MGKASKSKQDGTSSRRDKIAAQRIEAQRAERRNRLLIAGGAVIVVIVIVVVLIVVKATSSNTPSASGGKGAPTGTALTSVVSTLTSVPTSVTDAVGDGGGAVTGLPQTVSSEPALTASGKPEVLYIGAEYCPYCAAERWAMIVALSRFGTFSGLSTTHSSSTDVYPNTPTWTFHGSTFTSNYITFTPKEMYTNIPSGSGYTTLDTLSSSQNSIFAKLDAPPYVQSTQYDESYPFVDFGNKYVIVGASYDPSILDGLTWATIANDLHNPSSSVAKAVNGTANYISAALCKLTDNQPSTACTSTVQSLQSKI